MFASVQCQHKELLSSHKRRNIRYEAAQPDVLGSTPLFFSVPSEGVEEEGSAFGHRAISLPSFSQSADKRAVQCQANSPQPTGCRLDDREQIKQKDECSLGVQAPSVLAVIPSFDPPFLCLFFATQLGTNPIVKGDCREHRDALNHFYRTGQMICHLSFLTSLTRPYSVSVVFFTAIPSLIGLKAIV